MLNRRLHLKTIAAAAAIVSGSLISTLANAADTIKVGVLHSLSGTM
ncbi:MAG: urea ABC transporter substrate-binding protein, partial [Burkholderiaceae bacterium]